MNERTNRGPEFQAVDADAPAGDGRTVLLRGPGYFGFGPTLREAFAQARSAGMAPRARWYAVHAPADAQMDEDGTVRWAPNPAFDGRLPWIAAAKRNPGPPHVHALPGGGDASVAR